MVAALIGSPFVPRSPVAFRSTVRALSLGCTPVYINSSGGIQAPIFIAMILAVFHSFLHWQVWNHRVTLDGRSRWDTTKNLLGLDAEGIGPSARSALIGERAFSSFKI